MNHLNPSPRRRRLRAEWLALGLALLLLAALVGYVLYGERQAATAREVDRLQVQARVIDENLIRQLRGANKALEGARDEYLLAQPRPVAAALSARLKLLSDAMPGVRGMAILDAGGTVVASSADALLGMNLSQREYFEVPRRQLDPAMLYVCAPFKSAPSGTLVVAVARLLRRPDGGFAGVVVATLDPDYFGTVMSSSIYASDMRTTATHSDGKVFLTIPHNPALLGLDVSTPGSILAMHLASGQLSTVFMGQVRVTGLHRMVVSRSVTGAALRMDKPIIVTVSRDLAAIYLPWRKRALEFATLYGLIAAALVLGLALIQRRRKTFDQLAAAAASERQRRAEQERSFKLLVEGVRDYAMYMLDPQGRITTWNVSAERNKGYDADQVLGQHFGMFFVPEDIASGKPAQELAQAARDGHFEAEDWRIRGDGSRFWAGVSLTAIHDAQQRLIGYAKITRDLTEQRRQRSEIEHALAEKETLLREVYHRVKNNLQVVQSLLNLQRSSLPEGAARTVLQDSVQRVRAMALVHEKLYQSGNLAAVSLKTYTRDLMRQIAEAHGAAGRRVKLHADIADVETGLDNAVPFGLLLTELVTNGFKHAFPQQRSGEIRVKLVRQVDGDLLTVADDGVGFAADFDPGAQTASMGFQLACGLARQLGGELQARSEGGAVLSAMLTRL